MDDEGVFPDSAAIDVGVLLTEVIDLLRMPVVLVDQQRRILLANRAALASFRSDGPLMPVRGVLRARSATADRELGAALPAVAAPPRGVRFMRLGPGRAVLGAPALIVTAVGGEAGSGPAGALMVRLIEPEAIPDHGELVLRQLLDLTPAECGVALGLAEGLSHDEIAHRRGVRVTTVRTVLRRLQEKLGIAKSARLARFVASLTATGGFRL